MGDKSYKGMSEMLKLIRKKYLLNKYEKLLNKDGVIPNVVGNEIVWILDTNTHKTYYPEISIAIVR